MKNNPVEAENKLINQNKTYPPMQSILLSKYFKKDTSKLNNKECIVEVIEDAIDFICTWN